MFPESIGEVDVCIQLDGIEELECEFYVALTTVGSAKAGESVHSYLTYSGLVVIALIAECCFF